MFGAYGVDVINGVVVDLPGTHQDPNATDYFEGNAGLDYISGSRSIDHVSGGADRDVIGGGLNNDIVFFMNPWGTASNLAQESKISACHSNQHSVSIASWGRYITTIQLSKGHAQNSIKNI